MMSDYIYIYIYIGGGSQSYVSSFGHNLNEMKDLYKKRYEIVLIFGILRGMILMETTNTVTLLYLFFKKNPQNL